MGTGPDNHTRRMPILCHVHRRFLQAHLDLSDETEERSVRTLPEVRSRIQKTTGRHVHRLRSDGGKEYFSDEFTAYLQKEGIRREFSCRHTPQQNGVAERKNRHIVEVARAMMNEKNLPKWYWAKAANTAAYVMNKCTTSGVHDVTPHEKFFGKKSDLSHVRIFGSIAYVHIPDDTRQKLDPK